jgi:PAS domain S-box-containing protein
MLMGERMGLSQDAASARGSSSNGVSLSTESHALRQRVREVEAELHRVEDRYQALVRAAAQISWTTPPDGQVEDLPLWRAYTGQTQEEVRGWGWLDALHPDDRQPTAEAWSRAVAGRAEYAVEYRLRRADGVFRTMLVRAVPVLEASGGVREWVGFCTDIHELKLAEASRSAALEAEREARSRAEAATARLRTVLDVLPMGIFIANTSGRLVERNAAARALWGEGQPGTAAIAGERTYQGWWASTGEPIASEEWALSRALTQGETFIGEEIHILNFQGQRKTVLNSAAPIRDAAGEITGGVVALVDITERKRLEEALSQAALEAAARASELDAIFDALPDGIIFYDPDGRILRANPLAREFLGLAAEFERHASKPLPQRGRLFALRDESGQPLLPEDSPARRVVGGERLSGARAVDIMMRAPDGRDWQLSVSGTPIRDAEGRQTGAVCVFRDVTARRHLERRTQETLETMLALASDMARAPESERDDEARISGATEAMARRLLDLTRGLLGCQRVVITTVHAETERIELLATTDTEPEVERSWRAELPKYTLSTYLTQEQITRLTAGQVVVAETDFAHLLLRPTHGAPHVLMAPLLVGARLAGLLSLDFGAVPHVFREEDLALAGAMAKLAAVVLERERLLRERASAHAKTLALQDANRRMDTFMSIASHELRTPMTSVKANIQMAERMLRPLLRAEALAPEQAATVARAHSLLERADRQFIRQNRLVGDLLDASRLRAGRQLELRRERVDLAALVGDLIEEQRLANPEREITSALDPGPLPVFADPDRVAHVLFNYLSNALKYSAEDRPVSIWLHVRGRVAKVSVRDHGLGLPPGEQGRIWKRFYRVESNQEQSGSSVGLGLGLHISRTIIERHGGQVGVRSAPGKGATFWFTLPLLDEADIDVAADVDEATSEER